MTSIWAVVPAAGVGNRMGAAVPKQYLELAGRYVIDHALDTLVSHPRISGVVVALGQGDPYWPQTAFAGHPRISVVTGGDERVHSVRNALVALVQRASADDWVMVHDAARPCLRTADIDRLIDVLCQDSTPEGFAGALLGMPVRDTMKQTDVAGRVEYTLDRSAMWHAFTPQIFRIGQLTQAIALALQEGVAVTDEAAAMERLGARPLMVEGHPDNIKITRPLDLALAEFFLANPQQAG